MTQAFNLSQLANNLNTSGQLDATDGLTGAVPVANGGTGQSSLSANAVLLGNGTSGVQSVAPSTSGNILTSNGTTWVSQAPSGGGVTSFNDNTGDLDGWQYITSGTFSGATNVNIGSLPSGYKIFRFVYVLQASSSSGNYELAHRISTNNGSSYLENIYRYLGYGWSGPDNAIVNINATTAQGSLRVTKGSNIGSATPYTAVDSYLYQPISSPSGYSWIQGQSSFITNSDSGGSSAISYGGTCQNGSYVNGFQLTVSSGSKTLTGEYQVYGSK